MTGPEDRSTKTLRLFRVLRWVMLVIGVLEFAFGIFKLVAGEFDGWVYVLLGVIFVTMSILYSGIVRKSRQLDIGEADEKPPTFPTG